MTNEIQQEIERDESNPLVRAMLLNLPVSGVYPRNMPFSYCVNFEGIEDPLLGGVLITGERNFQKDNLRVQVELNFDYLKSIGDLEFGLEVIRNISCAFGNIFELREELFDLQNKRIATFYDVPICEEKLLNLRGDILQLYGNRTRIPYWISQKMSEGDYSNLMIRIDECRKEYHKGLDEFRRRNA